MHHSEVNKLAVVIIIALLFVCCLQFVPLRAKSFVTLKSTISISQSRQLPVRITELSELENSLEFATEPQRTIEAVSNFRNILLKNWSNSKSIKTILSRINSKFDFPINLSFQIGAQGEISSPASYRALLLDVLGFLDNREAVKISKQILTSSNSPEEWAVAMRNYSWGVDDSQNDQFLRAKAFELVSNKDWSQNPSNGFLEAFDFIPFTKNIEAIPVLGNYLNSTNSPSLRHAAFIALDKLTEKSPDAVLPIIAEHDEIFSNVPLIRAGLMARANLASRVGVATLENYLSSSNTSASEVNSFAALIPLAAEPVGSFLATSVHHRTLLQLAKQDQFATVLVDNWLKNNRFPKFQTQLSDLRNRLSERISSAQAGGLL